MQNVQTVKPTLHRLKEAIPFYQMLAVMPGGLRFKCIKNRGNRKVVEEISINPREILTAPGPALRNIAKRGLDGFDIYYFVHAIKPGVADYVYNPVSTDMTGHPISTADISHYRFIPLDFDININAVGMLEDANISPFAVIRTSPGKSQALIRVEELSEPSAYLAVSQYIQELTGSDRVYDLPRVLRAPGFPNWKYIDKGRKIGPELIDSICASLLSIYPDSKVYQASELSETFEFWAEGKSGKEHITTCQELWGEKLQKDGAGLDVARRDRSGNPCSFAALCWDYGYPNELLEQIRNGNVGNKICDGHRNTYIMGAMGYLRERMGWDSEKIKDALKSIMLLGCSPSFEICPRKGTKDYNRVQHILSRVDHYDAISRAQKHNAVSEVKVEVGELEADRDGVMNRAIEVLAGRLIGHRTDEDGPILRWAYRLMLPHRGESNQDWLNYIAKLYVGVIRYKDANMGSPRFLGEALAGRLFRAGCSGSRYFAVPIQDHHPVKHWRFQRLDKEAADAMVRRMLEAGQEIVRTLGDYISQHPLVKAALDDLDLNNNITKLLGGRAPKKVNLTGHTFAITTQMLNEMVRYVLEQEGVENAYMRHPMERYPDIMSFQNGSLNVRRFKRLMRRLAGKVSSIDILERCWTPNPTASRGEWEIVPQMSYMKYPQTIASPFMLGVARDILERYGWAGFSKRKAAEGTTRAPMVADNYATPMFDKFLRDIFREDEEGKLLVYRIIGYQFMPTNSHSKLFLYKGLGGTGKTTLVDFIQMLLPASHRGEVTFRRLGDASGAWLGPLDGAMSVKIEEVESDDDNLFRSAECALKAATGSAGTSVRQLFENEKKVPSTWRFHLITNKDFRGDDAGGSFTRRLVSLKFMHRRESGEEVHDLAHEIARKEGAVIATKAALHYILGLNEPDMFRTQSIAQTQAEMEIRRNMGGGRTFLEKVVIDHNGKIISSKAMNAILWAWEEMCGQLFSGRFFAKAGTTLKDSHIQQSYRYKNALITLPLGKYRMKYGPGFDYSTWRESGYINKSFDVLALLNEMKCCDDVEPREKLARMVAECLANHLDIREPTQQQCIQAAIQIEELTEVPVGKYLKRLIKIDEEDLAL